MDTYFFYTREDRKISRYRLAELAAEFKAIDSPKTLASLLHVSKSRLKELARAQPYDRFYLAKASGGARLIEHPDEPLKRLQSGLKIYFDAVYDAVKPACAHGAILATLEEAVPRSILTNAKAHIGRAWFLSLDIRDFFHSVPASRVRGLLMGPLFGLPDKVAELVTDLVTAQHRLPMGAPTSPVLANLACLSLDRALAAWAVMHQRSYTRFIDDLTFSGASPFNPLEIKSLEAIIEKEGFPVNTEKTVSLQLSQQPEVTGLIVGQTEVDVSPAFLSDLVKGIELYHRVIASPMAERQVIPSQILRHIRRHLSGQLSFLAFVRGSNHTSFIRLKKRLFEGVAEEVAT